ncbi:hypothetical protein [Cellulomonas sp. Marseille-Q8402]
MTAALLLIAAVTGLAGCTDDSPPTAAATGTPSATAVAEGVPTLVTPAELVTFAGSRGLVYWAGEVADHSIEVTAGSAATYVRYLPAGAAAGTDEPALTVATYPDVDGYASLQALDGAGTTVAASGALIFAPESAPSSVYFAFPGSTFQVEVYSPAEGHALELTNGGSVRPVVPQEQ